MSGALCCPPDSGVRRFGKAPDCGLKRSPVDFAQRVRHGILEFLLNPLVGLVKIGSRPGYPVCPTDRSDIERAVVQRMIELIRRYYSGNFNWESLRLGRTVVLSARPEHQKELEDFLIKEFFRVGATYPP